MAWKDRKVPKTGTEAYEADEFIETDPEMQARIKKEAAEHVAKMRKEDDEKKARELEEQSKEQGN
jgi:ABC-type Zn uptake system ZnuABC Zn-binding protein ZnuA